MCIRKWRVNGVGQSIVACAKDMPNFMSDGDGDGGAGVMHDEIGFFRIGRDARRKTTSTWVVDDEADDVGALFVSQTANVLERHIAIDHVVKIDELVGTLLIVVDFLGVDEPNTDVTD